MTAHPFSIALAPADVGATPWDSVLVRVHAQMVGAGRPAEGSASACAQAVARAHSRLLVALDGRSNAGADTVSELVASAVKLLHSVAALGEAYGERTPDLGSELDDALARRLGAHEQAVLAGEVTYRVRCEEADEAAARMRGIVARLPREERVLHGDLLSLRIAGVELGSLLVRAAGNVAAGGRADQAPEARSALLNDTLQAITLELANRAQAVGRPLDERGDVAAHHLAAGLRVRASEETLHGLASASGDRAADTALLHAARDAWLALATHEHVVVTALDGQLEVPTYRERFGSLTEAIVEGAANVVCGARLAGRPSAFRHREAWGHHAIALTYALEAYVGGLRGDSRSFARAQLIALTRLVRAVAAIALLDIRRAWEQSGNGSRTH